VPSGAGNTLGATRKELATVQANYTASPTPATHPAEPWLLRHNDAYHPGLRDSCSQCQEMIRLFGPMPSPEEIYAAEQARALRTSGKTRVKISEATRWAVWERDDFRCQRCGSRRFLAVDHIIPASKGGKNELANYQTLCRSCNSSKKDRLPGAAR